jgi:hypothetical protein
LPVEFETSDLKGAANDMNEINLCLLLMDSLDAAYRCETYRGPERLADWGLVVVRLIRRAFPDQKRPQEEMWDIARRVLWDLACAHSADELSRHFLLRPEAFFRSIVMLYVHGALETDSRLQPTATLH